MILLMLFGPSFLGVLLLLFTCIVTRNLRWLAVACAVAILLHCVSIGVQFGLVAASGAGGGGGAFDLSLFGEELIIGWSVIGVIALVKYGSIKHAQTRR